MPRILVTNDDGVRSDGIYALADALRPLGDVLVVAPHVEASAIGHALTLRRPLRLETVRDGVYEVDGTPTDCVNIAVTKLYTSLPDLVVSGINKGFNLGDDITYSGTVAGAMEGALLGVASIAVSLAAQPQRLRFRPVGGRSGFRRRADPARPSAAANLSQHQRPVRPAKRIALTVQAKRNHVTIVDERCDPRGQNYYWIEEGQNDWEPHDRSDYQAVRDGFVSVTPLQPDLTDYTALSALEHLPLDSEAPVK